MVRAIILAALLSTGCGDDKPPMPPTEAGAPGVEAGAGDTTGSPCKSSPDCEGRICLTQVVWAGQPTLFPDGYCSRKCPGKIGCIASETCFGFLDAGGTLVANYCVVPCPTGGCRQGYVCTSAGLCLPK